MAADLESRIAELAAEWDALVGPIRLADLRGRPAPEQGGATMDELIDPFATSPRPRRWWALAGSGLVAAALLVGLVVLLTRRDAHDPAEPDGTVPPTSIVATTLGPEISVVDTSVAVTTAAPASTGDPATTTATTLSDEQSAAQLDEIRTEVTRLLAGFDSFRAVATTTQRSTPAPDDTSEEPNDLTTTNTVTLRADGSMWAENETGWNAYDATTGIARIAWTNQDGSVAYQEVVGWGNNSVPLNVAAGYDPTQLGVGGAVAISEITSHLGRPAWKISWSFPIGAAQGSDAGAVLPIQEDSMVIDQTTGLVIQRTTYSVQEDGGESFEDSRLDEIELGVELPATWPGSFPEGATVDRSGDPNGFTPMTIEQAAAEFGPGLAVPTDREVSSIAIGQISTAIGSTRLTTLTQEVTITAHTGFARSLVVFSRILPIEGTPPPEGVADVGGSWCSSTDGATCTPSFGEEVIDAGALTGAQTSVRDGFLGTQIGPITVRVVAGSDADAWALVRSLVAV